MLRWTKSGRRPWLGACINSFASPYASKAGTHLDRAQPGTRLKVSASKASRIHGNARVSESKLRRHSAHDSSSDANISVRTASRQDVDANLYTHLVDGDPQVSGTVAHMLHAEVLCSARDPRGAETIASSRETPSLHVAWKTFFKQTEKEAQNALSDLQQKMKLLESEQFSPSDARKLLKSRAVMVSSVEQIATALQELKKCFPCAELVREIVVQRSKILLQPAELVQQKVKLLRDFHLEEKVVSKLCSRSGVLIISMESLQERLAFFEGFGLTVAARNTVFWKAPLVLSFSLQKSIQPPLQFLEREGFTRQSILKIVQSSPHIFYVSFDSLVKKYEYIRQLGLSVDRFPTPLFARSLSVKVLEEHRQSLRAIGFTEDEISLMLKVRPAILRLCSESVRCKVDYLINKQHRKLAEIAHCPRCLLYSLQGRMLPRFHVVKELAPSKTYSLSYILFPSDSALANLLGKALHVENGQELVASKLKEAKGKALCLQQAL